MKQELGINPFGKPLLIWGHSHLLGNGLKDGRINIQEIRDFY